MRTNKATGSARQVREAAQEVLLERVRRKVFRLEEEVACPELYWFLLDKFGKKLQRPKDAFFQANTVLIIPGLSREHVILTKVILLKVEELISRFQHSEEEGAELFARLFRWAASKIAQPHHDEYRRQEEKMFRELYSVKHSTDEVPYN